MGNKNIVNSVHKKSKMKITVLGSGTSTGVPTLGCKCSVCLSDFVKNKRLRSSIVININEKNILVDASTDLRTQLLNNKIDDIDGCIITHEHADHTHGIDDLRPFCFKKADPIPVFASVTTSEILESKFRYIFQRDKVFKDKKILGGGIPKLDLHHVTLGSQMILDEEFTFFSLPHGHHETLGFKVGKFAYIIDCNKVSDEIIEYLKNEELDLLIIDCLRIKKHQTHLHLDLSLEYAKRIGATKTGFTHMSHDFEHEDFSHMLCNKYGSSIFPLFDTQQIDLFY
jgi:phosphoribosyl 1,2-cyclic phosphate phosphodiesterase